MSTIPLIAAPLAASAAGRGALAVVGIGLPVSAHRIVEALLWLGVVTLGSLVVGLILGRTIEWACGFASSDIDGDEP